MTPSFHPGGHINGSEPAHLLSWVVPCFNEAGHRSESLVANVETLDGDLARLGLPFEVIWVDDGSADDTSAVLDVALTRFPRHRLLRHPINRGKGAALKTGFLAAKGAFIGFCDADLAVDLAVLPVLLSHVQGDHDAAIASKWRPGASTAYSMQRRVLSGLYRRAAQGVTGVGIMDFQCGMKVFRAANCQSVLVGCRQNGWLWDTEALARLGRNGARIIEVPATIRRGEAGRPSRLLVWRTVRNLTADWIQLWQDLRQ